MKRFRDAVLGICLAITTILLTTTIYAAYNKNISVTYSDIKLVINGQEVIPKDAAGNTVEPFIYNGTTYLPVRAVGDALNCDVAWDQNTKTVTLVGAIQEGEVVTVNPGAKKLIDILPPYTRSSSYYVSYHSSTDNESVKLGGIEYKNSLFFGVYKLEYASFNLSGKYIMLTGIVGSADGYTEDALITFIGDGNELKQIEIIGGALPQDFSLDVTGVRQLDIQVSGTSTNIAFAELLIE